jgi:hypothetical protein
MASVEALLARDQLGEPHDLARHNWGATFSTWEAWLAGRSGIKALDPAWSDDLPTCIGAPCRFDPTIAMPAFQARRLDPSSQMAVLAALQAWRQAGEPALAAERRAVVMGTGIGGLVTVVEQLEVLRLRGAERVNPLTVPMIMPNAAAAQVGLAIGATAAAAMAVSVRITAPAARASRPRPQAPGLKRRSAAMARSPLLCTRRSSSSCCTGSRSVGPSHWRMRRTLSLKIG